jgi:hypothetical protein
MALRWQRPTLDTRFHIDTNWWEEHGRDIRIYMRDLLCEECRPTLGSMPVDQLIDAVDPDTGEVRQVDALWDTVQSCCAQKADYLNDDAPIVDAIFRALVANGNKPMTIRELHALVGRRPPETLLRTLTAGEIYLGIKPYRE